MNDDHHTYIYLQLNDYNSILEQSMTLYECLRQCTGMGNESRVTCMIICMVALPQIPIGGEGIHSGRGRGRGKEAFCGARELVCHAMERWPWRSDGHLYFFWAVDDHLHGHRGDDVRKAQLCNRYDSARLRHVLRKPAHLAGASRITVPCLLTLLESSARFCEGYRRYLFLFCSFFIGCSFWILFFVFLSFFNLSLLFHFLFFF